MRHIYQGTFKDQNGAVVGSSTTSDGNPGTVTVYLAGGTTLASVYTASTGGVAVNSVTTDAYGYFYFWVDDGDYAYGQLFKIILTHSDFTSRTYDNLNIILLNQLNGSITWNVSELVDCEGETSASITVSGAALGDFVLVSAPEDLAGLIVTAYVSAADTVKIRVQKCFSLDETNDPIDLSSGVWKVRVLK